LVTSGLRPADAAALLKLFTRAACARVVAFRPHHVTATFTAKREVTQANHSEARKREKTKYRYVLRPDLVARVSLLPFRTRRR